MDLNRNFVDHANPPLNERYELYRHLTPFTDASQAGIDAFRDGMREAGKDLDAASASSGSNGEGDFSPTAAVFTYVTAVPPAALLGGFTLANVPLESAFGENPIGRFAVDRAGGRARPSPAARRSTGRPGTSRAPTHSAAGA